MSYTITTDTGGTFTDLVLADEAGMIGVFKSPTTPSQMFTGIGNALTLAAAHQGVPVGQLLHDTTRFVYATTRGTNAILQGKTARTAFLTTEGHPDILLYREGGKKEPFNLRMLFPEPYVPRAMTFEVRERVFADGHVDLPLDEQRLHNTIERLAELDVEAIGVCLLWSIVNPEHEERIGRLIGELLPSVEVTLSHRLNPILREYRRASSTVIDASIKPLMRAHLHQIESQLRDLGFRGSPLMVSHVTGGVLPISEIAEIPLHTVDSGPALAPVAGLHYSIAETGDNAPDVIVVDAGGTSFDVSLISAGELTYTRERWLGGEFTGHMTGMPGVDARSVGAGGGSIAWIDPGGLLHVGPESASAVPGPAAYGKGGTRPTVTDAAVALGYIDPEFFLGGRMRLDADLARAAIERDVAKPLGLSIEEAGAAILAVASEVMRSFVGEMTTNQGLDPRGCLLVAGGGASGLNILTIARELGLKTLLIPSGAGALSAIGGQFADLVATFSRRVFTTSRHFAYEGVNGALAEMSAEMNQFSEQWSSDMSRRLELYCQARYLDQNWELDVPLHGNRFAGPSDVERLEESFHSIHERVFAVKQPGQALECIGWSGRARLSPPRPAPSITHPTTEGSVGHHARSAYFPGLGFVETAAYFGQALKPGTVIEGPAILEEPTTTIVIIPQATLTVTRHGNYRVEIREEENIDG